MNREHRPIPLFTQVDVTTNPATTLAPPQLSSGEQTHVLREILKALDRQNELIEELVTNTSQHQRLRDSELKKWRQEHPRLARNCRAAVDALGQVHAELLDSMTSDINGNADDMMSGDYALNEFVDRYGPRLAHLTGILHVLSQLGHPMNQTSNE